MAIQLNQIRVDVGLNADPYATGAGKKVAADEKMVESAAKLGVSLDQTDRRLGQSGTAAEKLARSLDPAYQAQKRFESGSSTLQRALDAGTISAQRHAELLALLERRYASTGVANDNLVTASARTASSYKTVGDAAKLSFVDQEILRAGLVNTVQSLAAGESAARTFQTQLFQTLPALQGVARSLGLTSAALVPLAVGAGAAAVSVGVLVAALVRASSEADNLRHFGAALDSIAKGSGTTAAGLQGVVRELEATGSSAEEATKVANMALRAAPEGLSLTTQNFRQLAIAARDVASQTGQEFTEAFDDLTKSLTGGADATVKYAASIGALSPKQIEQTRILIDQSRAQDAQRIAIDAITDTFRGKYSATLSDTHKLLIELRNAWTDVVKAFAETGIFSFAVEQLKGIADGIRTTIAEAQRIKDFVSPPGPSASARLPPTDQDQALLAEVRRRESGDRYNTLHATGQNVTSLADVEAVKGLASHAFGAYGFQPGTYREQARTLGFDPNDISRSNQDEAALNLKRRAGLNSTASWGASGPYDEAKILAASQATKEATKATDDLTKATATQSTAVSDLARENQKRLEVQQKVGVTQQVEQAGLEAATRADALKLTGDEKLAFIAEAKAQAGRLANAEVQKEIELTRLQTQGQLNTADAYIVSEAAARRARAGVQAELEVREKGGDVAQRQAEILRSEAAEAIRSAEASARAGKDQTQQNQALADASARGTAALKEQQIVNQAAVQTHEALAAAIASEDPALRARAEQIKRNAEAQLRANEATQNAIRLNTATTNLKDQAEELAVIIGLHGKSNAEISTQVGLLRAEQEIRRSHINTEDPALAAAQQKAEDSYRTQVALNGQLAEKLEQQRAAQARLDQEWQSIADTISNTVGTALDDLLSGKKIDDWGARFKEALASIASTIIRTELINPAIGSALGGLGATNAAQQYGMLGQSGGILSSLLGVGKVAGAANDLASSAAGGSGLFGGVSSSINSFGASAFGLANPALQGPTITGAALGETGTLGGLSLGGLIGPIGAIAGIAIPLISSLVGGNKKPSNNAGGVLYDLSTGQTSDAQGGGANLGVAQQITTSLAKFERDLAKLVPNAILPSGQVSVAKGDLTGITTEYTGPLGNIKASFASAQEAVAQFSVAIAQNLGGVSDTVKQVLSTITDPSQIEAALAVAKAYDEIDTAYDNLFQTIGVDSVRKIGPFEQILNKLNDQFDTLTQTAASYGLSLDPINAGYTAAKDRLAEDFNKTIAQLTQELVDPAAAAVAAEKKAGEDRVQDAKAVGADLAAVDAYNAANMKKATDAQTKGIEDVAKAAADFQESIGTSFDSIFGSFEQLIGPFEKAANSLSANLQKLTDQAVAAGYATDAITASAADARKRLTQDFDLNIKSLTQAITDPVQAAIDVEQAAGQQRIRDAVVVSGNLEDVNRYNTANLERVTQAAKGAVTNLASAQQVASTAASSLNAAISNVLGTGKGQYAQALDALAQQLAALISAAEKVGPLGDLTGIINAFGLSLVDLRNAFDTNIRTLTLGITDPFQQALNIELIAGQRRVSEAQAIGADLALVDEYNRQNLLAVAKAAGTATDAIATAAGFNQDISQQILAIRDPVAAALQAELDAGEKRVAAAQQVGADLARVDELNRLKLLQVVDTTEDSTAALDKFTGRLQSLESALSQLTSGPLSGLTPAQSVTASSANFDRLLAQVQAGNTDLIPDLAAAGTQAVQSSQSVYGNAKQTADLRARVTKALEDVAAQTGREASLVSQGVTVTAANQAQVKSSLQAQATSARKIADYAEAQADAEFKRTGVENQALRDQANAANAIARQLERQVIAVSAQTGVQNQIVASLKEQLSTQAAAARAIADQLQKQADIEYARTGIRQNIYQIESDGARQIAYFLDIQANAQNLSANALNAQAAQLQAQANTEAARTGVVNNVYQQQADFSRTLAYLLSLQASGQVYTVDQLNAQGVQLQAQANIETAKTGVVYNIFQQQADAARNLAALLAQSGYQQTDQVNFLQLAARQAHAIADTLQAQADADYQRTGVKNILLQDEAAAAHSIGINLDKQATSQGQLSQTDASRVQLAVALLQQDAAVAARTAQQQAGEVPVATGNVGTPEQQAAYLAAVQQQASAVAIRVGAEQQGAQQAEAARVAGEQQNQQQDAAAQANLALILRQQQAISRLQQFIGGDREVGVMLAQLVRYGTVVQDYYSLPYLARDWLQYAYGFVQNWTASEPFSLSDMLAVQGFATGTGSTPPGWIRVGERGPELIKQPGGATILPYGVSPPAAANDNLVAEIRRLQDMFAALVRQMQGGQQVASRDAKVIAEETANVGRKIAFGPPVRRMVG